jgi:uncharacterized protein (DUF4415 family)
MAIVYRTKETLGRGRVDRKRLLAMTDEEIMRTSPPELANLPDDFWKSAVVVPPIFKEPISLRVDEDVLEWFRARGPRYQSRMNAVLRSYMQSMIKRPGTKPRRPSRVAEAAVLPAYRLRGSKPSPPAARVREAKKR